MSYCREEGKDGKDRVLFATKEDLEAPISEELQYLAEDDDEEAEGLILPNGGINWSCPCLGGMASGPCGMEFREAFSCFHYSTAEPKGSDCIDHFRKMQECMTAYPTLYPMNDDGAEPELPQENQDSEVAAPSGAPGESSEEQQTKEPVTQENVS